MTSRSQITIDPQLQRRARRKAEAQGISFAEYVRRLIDLDLGSPGEKPDVSAFFDLGRSKGETNVARDKDRMLAEAVLDSRRKR